MKTLRLKDMAKMREGTTFDQDVAEMKRLRSLHEKRGMEGKCAVFLISTALELVDEARGNEDRMSEMKRDMELLIERFSNGGGNG